MGQVFPLRQGLHRGGGFISAALVCPSQHHHPRSSFSGGMGGGQSKARAQSLEQEVERLKQELSDAKHETPRPTDGEASGVSGEAEAPRQTMQVGEERDTTKRMESAGDMVLKVFSTLARDSAPCNTRDCTVDWAPPNLVPRAPVSISHVQEFLPFSALFVCLGPVTVLCSILCSWPMTALGRV